MRCASSSSASIAARVRRSSDWAFSPGSPTIGSPSRTVTATPRRRFVRPFVATRCPPQTAAGMMGAPDCAAIRAAPALRSFTVKLVLIVASGKTPTTSPSFRARTAASNAAAPALRSTGMWCMARMNRPANQWSKTDDFAMNRTSRCCGRAPSPRKVKSKKLTWLLQMIAPPVAGTCSEPRTSNWKRNSRNTTSAIRMTNRYGRSPRAGADPNRSRRTTSRQLAVYMSEI